jgi:hypothetical protein
MGTMITSSLHEGHSYRSQPVQAKQLLHHTSASFLSKAVLQYVQVIRVIGNWSLVIGH